MKSPIIVTSGEPAGIGPDICLEAAIQCPSIVLAGDLKVLAHRAKLLGKKVDLVPYEQGVKTRAIQVLDFPCLEPVEVGVANFKNAKSVLQMLDDACRRCLNGEFSALVTAPVNKYILQKENRTFYGHTEFFQNICHSPEVVMMLADTKFRVALVTSHLPLRAVPDAITKHKIISVAQTVYRSLKVDFQIKHPRIALAGLNPHAGEQGILGVEEQEIIIPAVNELKGMGIDILGPLPADTMFIDKTYDAYIAMYHDQGLSVLKYATFGKAANISLGLPIIRTSVDHGTAFHLAGTGQASAQSLLTAIKIAKAIQKNRRGIS